jgi:hypothetical protein
VNPAPYLEAALTWLAHLLMNHFVSVREFCGVLYRVMKLPDTAVSLACIRTCFVVCGRFLDRPGVRGRPITEVNLFYRFLKENQHPEGYLRFLQAELIALRENDWVPPSTAAIESTRGSMSAPAQKGAIDQRERGNIGVLWDEAIEAWLGSKGDRPIRLPEGVTDPKLGLEILVWRVQTWTKDLERKLKFVALAFLALVPPNRSARGVKEMSDNIGDILQDGAETPAVGTSVLTVFAELCAKSTEFGVRDLAQIYVSIKCRKPKIPKFLEILLGAYCDVERWIPPEEAAAAAGILSNEWREEVVDVVWGLAEIVDEVEVGDDRLVNAFWIGLFLRSTMRRVLGQPGDYRENFRPYSSKVAQLSAACPHFVSEFIIALLNTAYEEERLTEEQLEKWRCYITCDLGID